MQRELSEDIEKEEEDLMQGIKQKPNFIQLER